MIMIQQWPDHQNRLVFAKEITLAEAAIYKRKVKKDIFSDVSPKKIVWTEAKSFQVFAYFY